MDTDLKQCFESVLMGIFSPPSKTFFVVGDNELSKSWQVSNILFPCGENRTYIYY